MGDLEYEKIAGSMVWFSNIERGLILSRTYSAQSQTPKIELLRFLVIFLSGRH